MTDKYKALREAAETATPGPWERHELGGFTKCVRQLGTGRGICSTFVQNQPKTPAGWESQRHQNNANSDYIAAANPATIQTLIAERDALKHDVEEYVHIASVQATEIIMLREALARIEGLALADDPRDLPTIAKTANTALAK